VDVSRLADIEEIRDLTFRYSEGWDFKDWDVLLDVFTEDAVWDPSALGMPKAKGMEELRPLFDGFCRTMVGGSQHIQGNLRVHFLDPDNATGRCYVIGQTRNATGGDTEVMGFYEDVYRRVDGRWKLASRITKPFMAPTMGGLV
jgi:uncharacterized protein (TIGR02246 family)